MKCFFAILVFSLSINLNAEVYKVLVTGWEYKAGFDYVLHLKSPLNSRHFVLDCQSFIHELVLYESEEEEAQRLFEMYLNPSACYEIGSWIISHTDMGGKMCFITDSIARTIEVDTINYQFCF